MRTRPHPWTVVVGVGALIGLLFASVSTFDFVMHLDRQVHDVHCSFVPGAAAEVGESGCQVTLVSPYSSVLRTTIWGGIPISLPAMAVFAFLLAFAVELVVTRRQRDPRAAGFLALGTALPALTSAVMAYLSLVELDAVCKLCIGIYVASAMCLTGGVGLFWLALRAHRSPVSEPAAAPPRPKQAQRAPSSSPGEPAWIKGGGDVGDAGDADDEPLAEPAPTSGPSTVHPAPRPALLSWGFLAGAFGIGLLFVGVPVLAYVNAAPNHERFIGTCGSLSTAPDEELLIPLDPHPGEPPVLELLDPLCPSCRGFEERVSTSGLAGSMNRSAMLFPLDNECNWMVSSSMHPGACAVSRAMICAGASAQDVLDWAFANQEAIRSAAGADPAAASQMAGQAFPSLASCIDAPATKAKLNRSLRWAVDNQLPVLTPQLYVGKVKLCEEDVDLGLDFALSRMLDRYREGTLEAVEQPELPPAPRSEPPPVAKPSVRAPATRGAEASPASGEGAAEPATGESAEAPATGEPDTGASDDAPRGDKGPDEPAAEDGKDPPSGDNADNSDNAEQPPAADDGEDPPAAVESEAPAAPAPEPEAPAADDKEAP